MDSLTNEPMAIVQPMAKSKASHTEKIMVLGKLLSQAELDAIADITEADKDAIGEDWEASVDPRYQNLLDADTYEQG